MRMPSYSDVEMEDYKLNESKVIEMWESGAPATDISVEIHRCVTNVYEIIRRLTDEGRITRQLDRAKSNRGR